MSGHAPGPDDFTVTATLSTPELRKTLLAFTIVLEDAEALVGPAYALLSGSGSSGKPGSKPPAGNMKAVELCRGIGHDVERMAKRVRKAYLETDPAECQHDRELHKQVLERYRRMLREPAATSPWEAAEIAEDASPDPDDDVATCPDCSMPLDEDGYCTACGHPHDDDCDCRPCTERRQETAADDADHLTREC